MANDDKRGGGQTSEAMKTAPFGAVYIWPHCDLGYPRALARKLNREDLMIVSPEWLEDRWRGLKLKGIRVDHATTLTKEQQHQLLRAFQSIKP